jgi:hypothetical protein
MNVGGACPRLIELPNVEILDLNSDEINSLDQLFDGMTIDAVNTKLRVLSFINNKMTSLKAKAFSRLVGLRRLTVHYNKFEAVEIGAFSGLVNLQELQFCSYDRLIKSLDLAVIGNEPDLANLRFLDLFDLREITLDSIFSSVDPSKLFAHCKHRVLVQADGHILQVQGGRELFDGLSKIGRIFLCLIYPRENGRNRINIPNGIERQIDFFPNLIKENIFLVYLLFFLTICIFFAFYFALK